MQEQLLDRNSILSGNSNTTQNRIPRELSNSAVQVSEGADVFEVTGTEVVRVDGKRLPANFTVGAEGATPH